MAAKLKKAIVADDYLELVKRFPLVRIKNDRHLKEAHKIIDELSIIGEDDLSHHHSGNAWLAGVGVSGVVRSSRIGGPDSWRGARCLDEAIERSRERDIGRRSKHASGFFLQFRSAKEAR